MAKRYWLLKSEPDVFSIDDLAKSPRRRTTWEGVRNYQARNFLREMKKGDLAFFYHSNAKPPAIAGTVTVVREAYPDPEQFDPKSPYHDPKSDPDDPRWDRIDVELSEKLAEAIPLPKLKGVPELAEMALFRMSRLSVQPVRPKEWRRILRLASS